MTQSSAATPKGSRHKGGTHPADAVAVLIGSDRVVVHGFGMPPMPRDWLRPGLRFIRATGSVKASLAASKRSRRALMAVWTGVLLLSAAAAAGIGYGMGASQATNKALAALARLSAAGAGAAGNPAMNASNPDAGQDGAPNTASSQPAVAPDNPAGPEQQAVPSPGRN